MEVSPEASGQARNWTPSEYSEGVFFSSGDVDIESIGAYGEGNPKRVSAHTNSFHELQELGFGGSRGATRCEHQQGDDQEQPEGAGHQRTLNLRMRVDHTAGPATSKGS